MSEKFLWAYGIKTNCYDEKDEPEEHIEYGFIIAKDIFTSAMEQIEQYYGEELDTILYLECIQYANVFRAKNKECWDILVSNLGWKSQLLEESL